MTNKKLLYDQDKFLSEELHCYTDQNGNRPCDNGMMCDKCMTDEIMENFNKKLNLKEK